jgi:Uma2 family endonuclease
MRVAVSTPLTVADLLRRLGDIPAKRVLLDPPPGTATERDLVACLHASNKRLVELVDGVLVEKAMGWRESALAGVILHYILSYLDKHDLGIALTADGPVRLRPRRIRIPDACFISWDRLPPDAEKKAVLRAIPNLAVEVISKGNTRREVEMKLRDYFKAGVELVWVIYPKTQTAHVHMSSGGRTQVAKEGKLDGGKVLPGFSLSLKKLFSRIRPRNSAH